MLNLLKISECKHTKHIFVMMLIRSLFRWFQNFIFTEFLITWVHVEIIMFNSRMVISSIHSNNILYSFCLHLTQFTLFTNYVCKRITIHGRQFEFPEAKVMKLGGECYNTSCENNVWHNDSDHACLPSRVLKMEGADLLLALFIRLLFFSCIYYDLFY